MWRTKISGTFPVTTASSFEGAPEAEILVFVLPFCLRNGLFLIFSVPIDSLVSQCMAGVKGILIYRSHGRTMVARIGNS
jgi:hypothetical protein